MAIISQAFIDNQLTYYIILISGLKIRTSLLLNATQ